MQVPRFNLKIAFLVMTNVCVLAWTFTTLRSFGWFSFLLLCSVGSFTTAISGLTKRVSTVALGVAGGAISAILLVTVLQLTHVIGYFFHEGPEEYFEDGAFVELVTLPILFGGMLAGIGAGVGFGVGAAAWVCQQVWTDLRTGRIRRE